MAPHSRCPEGEPQRQQVHATAGPHSQRVVLRASLLVLQPLPRAAALRPHIGGMSRHQPCNWPFSNHHNRSPRIRRKQDIIKELTTGRWAIEWPTVISGSGPIVLDVSWMDSDLELPSVLAPAILDARTAAAKQPFASADTIAFTLQQPHIIDLVVRFSISRGRDIA